MRTTAKTAVFRWSGRGHSTRAFFSNPQHVFEGMQMATRKSAKETTKGRSASRESNDAISLLTQDHRNVEGLFKQFEGLDDDDENKVELVRTICAELTVHATIEEEIFYPAAREALGEDGKDVLDEAEVEHAGAKDLIAQLEEAAPGDDLYDAKVTVLAEYIRHHVKEEEGELFPKLKGSDLDLDALGEEMRARKEELQVPAEV